MQPTPLGSRPTWSGKTSSTTSQIKSLSGKVEAGKICFTSSFFLLRTTEACPQYVINIINFHKKRSYSSMWAFGPVSDDQ